MLGHLRLLEEGCRGKRHPRLLVLCGMLFFRGTWRRLGVLLQPGLASVLGSCSGTSTRPVSGGPIGEDGRRWLRLSYLPDQHGALAVCWRRGRLGWLLTGLSRQAQRSLADLVQTATRLAWLERADDGDRLLVIGSTRREECTERIPLLRVGGLLLADVVTAVD